MTKLIVLLTALSIGILEAQSPNASLTGRVTDSSKAIILDAHIVAINAGTNIR
jgi:hypothetical protein